ncbi:hypothetical protein [uncultured Dubosiella sp.]|uniref:hypothetical protein n=3 Tax=uncultured Dubosiella sp. TaxID=1937011 RepID=UPI002595F12E|nr:hypothetical protein [uncultured Dubosiella sp.]
MKCVENLGVMKKIWLLFYEFRQWMSVAIKETIENRRLKRTPNYKVIYRTKWTSYLKWSVIGGLLGLGIFTKNIINLDGKLACSAVYAVCFGMIYMVVCGIKQAKWSMQNYSCVESFSYEYRFQKRMLSFGVQLLLILTFLLVNPYWIQSLPEGLNFIGWYFLATDLAAQAVIYFWSQLDDAF